jgi:hypothetical protein
MEAKHTPGPWEPIHGCKNEGFEVYGPPHKDRSGSVQYLVAKLPYDSHAKANARLIAAAPGLLEALDRAVQDIDSGWADDAEDRFPWLIDARAAIAKARGDA